MASETLEAHQTVHLLVVCDDVAHLYPELFYEVCYINTLPRIANQHASGRSFEMIPSFLPIFMRRPQNSANSWTALSTDVHL